MSWASRGTHALEDETKVTADYELYELLMMDYQITEIDRLNQVLKRNRIDDPALRKSICEEFADLNGSFFDQGWLGGEAEGRVWPEITFPRRTLDAEEGLGHMEELIVPEYASYFHEYASGAVEYYFDERGESLGHIQVGSAGGVALA